jgi:hypothetical protein
MPNERFITAVCPQCGLKQAFDKSEICIEGVETAVLKSAKPKSKLCDCTVTCTGYKKNGDPCNHRFKVTDVDCEGYL